MPASPPASPGPPDPPAGPPLDPSSPAPFGPPPATPADPLSASAPSSPAPSGPSPAAPSGPSPAPSGPSLAAPSGPRRAAPPGPLRRPRAPGPRRPTGLLLISILALLAAVLLLIFVLRLSTQPGGKLNIGASEFNLGRASFFASEIATNGPLILPALHGSTITLYVQHLGKTPEEGWLAFNAHDPSQASSCYVRWRPAQHDFLDACDQAIFPADGQGLDQYATDVNSTGNVIVDLHEPIGTTPPSATTSTTINPSAPTTSTTSITSTTLK